MTLISDKCPQVPPSLLVYLSNSGTVNLKTVIIKTYEDIQKETKKYVQRLLFATSEQAPLLESECTQ